ncbi:MAG TPA: hypothetical protein VFL13_04085, partial [Candidatus Baltobacteraceae bacterium]|nr:hypothetical protein [Candidatus Baltobacteraceae bacterium]
PSNKKIIYAGTGEADIRGDVATGDGVYRSTDGGKTWKHLGLADTHNTTSIVVDPRSSNVAYVSSMGHVFGPNAERGVYKTTDGGATWTKVLFVDENTGSAVVVMDQKHPDTLYASMWQAVRKPWILISGGAGSGLYKTTDGGAHWSKISSNPGFAAGPLGKMGVTVSAANPRQVLAIVQAHQGGVFRSDDGGATWKRVNSEMKLRQRAFYYMGIYADPANAKVAYAPQVDGVFKTTDAGRTWKAITPPGDHHIVWINPNHPNILEEGDDGGAIVSVDGGKTWSTELNQPTGQFYKLAIDHQFPFHVYGAQQDDGAFEMPSASNEGLGLNVVHSVALGESTWVAPDPRDPKITYGSGYESSMAQLNTATGEEKNVSPWPKYMSGTSSAEARYRFGWTHPILFSPSNPHELLVGAQVVFSSMDYGQHWKVLSPDLTRNDPATQVPSGGPIDLDQTGVEKFPDIASLAASPLDSNVLWAGSADGLVHVTTDHGGSWKLVTPPELPQWAQISSIEPSHFEKGTAYLTASRFQWDDVHPYVYVTHDYGAHWASMNAGIPDDQYVYVVRQDPRDARVLLAGTRSTVYVSYNGGAWEPLTLNLPYVQVRDMQIDARQGDIAIATHGRGFWVLDNLKLLEDVAGGAAGAPARAELFAPEGAWLSHAYGGGGFGFGGQNPAYGTAVFFNVPDSYDGRTPFTLSFLDGNGRTVRSFTMHLRGKKEKPPTPAAFANMDQVHVLAATYKIQTAVDKGMNSFVWDMRYAPAAEVNGARAFGTDDFGDSTQGPTIVPGVYTVEMRYGSQVVRHPFRVTLDPRLHPASGALAARLALAMRLHGTLDRLNRTLNAALAARSRLTGEKRAALDEEIASLVQLNVRSSEGDLLHESKLRDHLAFLMNSLDIAYQAPTAAEYATASELEAAADAGIGKLNALMR